MHLAMVAKKGIDIPSLMVDLSSSGFSGGLDIGVDIDDIAERLPLIKAHGLRWSAGLYPGHAEAWDMKALVGRLKEVIETHDPDALGEMGLDYHWGYGDKARQKSLFVQQLKLAETYRKPVIIHNREADEDILQILTDHRPAAGHILHCYAADSRFLDAFIDLGGYISIAGNVTYKKSEDIREAASRVPLDQLLLETDSPYLAPIPHRGRINTPKLILHTYEYVAELRGMEVERLAEAVTENFFRLFPAT